MTWADPTGDREPRRCERCGATDRQIIHGYCPQCAAAAAWRSEWYQQTCDECDHERSMHLNGSGHCFACPWCAEFEVAP